jgi:hypothetical protein
MKSMSFRYTKANGDVSTRVFIPIVTPSKNYFGIDISELDIDEQLEFEQAMKDIYAEKELKLAELMHKYDVRHSFRTFSPERMEDVEVLEVE